MQRSNLITSQQAVAPGVMIRSSTAGSHPSTFAAALSVSKNAKDVIAVATTATTGHTRRPWRNGFLPFLRYLPLDDRSRGFSHLKMEQLTRRGVFNTRNESYTYSH
ncbi:hypothetical protein FOIG_12704 [Fusarium odoratissimum NRRL 54006]|uniref:Uncharacterized protein n=2 Tax=Fusarium oxysporum species complex TaxID=171631 RepID=X0KC11_FUSO5|nr:uncharacterized protein FOIG_12704 [Fusarium odoratissimum NRRL 54006]EXL94509.1 hypothetical protein FOIG_12704 [Fusarium odoratissimum NRRL 54006]TXB97398.1 hypothetical protein FocTR4_00011014 [Fusarium oxysporum f. sp. cubense]